MAERGVEILCVGTELLLGSILNGNARWIAEQLAGLGLPHYRQTVVGDNVERLTAAAREAAERSSCSRLVISPMDEMATLRSGAAASTRR